MMVRIGAFNALYRGEPGVVFGASSHVRLAQILHQWLAIGGRRATASNYTPRPLRGFVSEPNALITVKHQVFMDDQRVTVGGNDAAPAGWLGRLTLGFERRNGRTLLATRRHQGPFTVQRAFYPEEDYPQVYLLHPPGGVVGGDRLELSVDMGIGSHALLTMPGATKFYRSAGAQAGLKQVFTLADDSILEWLPQGNIFFPGAKVLMDSEFTLHSGARLLGFETLCFGRPVMDEGFELGQLNSRLRINLPHSPGLSERLRIVDGDLGKLGNYPLNATFFAAPASDDMLNAVREILSEANSPAAGASLVDQVLVARLLDDDNQRLQTLLHRIWLRLRPMMLGREAVIPRIWST